MSAAGGRQECGACGEGLQCVLCGADAPLGERVDVGSVKVGHCIVGLGRVTEAHHGGARGWRTITLVGAWGWTLILPVGKDRCVSVTR